MATTIRKGENDARQLLLGLGMGNYNATIAIQYMFLAPSATDPAMPSIVLMTKHLQLGLRAAGAKDIAITGQIDLPTGTALRKLLGSEWNHVTWYSLFRAVSEAKRLHTLEIAPSADSLGFIPDLPSIPGGTITWAALAVGAYLLLRKKR